MSAAKTTELDTGSEGQTPENLTKLKPEPETKDLNFRLKAMENSLQNLGQRLDSSQDSVNKEFQQILADVKDNMHQDKEEFRSETKDARIKLGYLEGSYQNLEKQSAMLAEETARLTLLLNKTNQEQSDSIHSLEKNSSEQYSKISKAVDSLDDQLGKLINDFTMLSIESQSLIDAVADKTSNLEKNFSGHESDFKKLAQQVEAHNKQVDSRLEQVGHNFSFHDAKIMKLHEKDTELEDQNENLKGLLQQAETEQKQTVESLEKNLQSKITVASDEAEEKHQRLSHDHESLKKRTSEVESKAAQLDTSLKDVAQVHQQQISAHEEQLATHNTNLNVHETRLEQLKSVDEELNLRAQGLKETTERLNEHSETLEKTTVSLQEQSQDLQDAVNQLNEQNVVLEEKTDELGLQIVTNSQTERQHFQTMTMAVSIVAILTIIALIYSFINQQSLWQSSMDNDVAVERRINQQLSEQQTQISKADQQLSEQQAQLNKAEQQREELEVQVAILQVQVKQEQEKANVLVRDSQEKSDKIVQLKDELKEVDDNVQFLNSSVGPLSDYHRYTGKEMHDTNWLAQQPASHYAVQLVSVDSKQKLFGYLEKNGYSLQADLAWFTISENGKEYFILTYGSFSDLPQARAALSHLPSNLVEQSPGISRLKDIQSFIH